MVRTVVNLAETGQARDPDAYINSLDIDPAREILYFGVGLTGLYRSRLPDGVPEQIGDGEGIRAPVGGGPG